MTKIISGYSVAFIPRSWALGAWHKPHKSIYAFGPLRFVRHVSLGPWKPREAFVPNLFAGEWLKGPSPSERLSDRAGTPAGGALEPINHKTATMPKRR